jgi:hypothetical protein
LLILAHEFDRAMITGLVHGGFAMEQREVRAMIALDSVPRPFLACGMAKFDEPIRPMTLGGMRRQGVRALFATCQNCGHERAVNMDDWPDDATVPSFGPRMRCTRCGKLGATAIPNWIEQADRLPGGARR